MTDRETTAEISLALRRVLQAGREMQSAVARRLGIRVTDVQAVDHVVSTEMPVGTVELGRRLGIRSASASVLVDRLVEAGHLVRDTDANDRRRVTLSATEHARKEVREALSPLLDRVAVIAGRLDAEQAETVHHFLGEVAAAMRDYAAESSRAEHTGMG